MHFFHNSKPIDSALYESLKSKISDLLELPKQWTYLGHNGDEIIKLEEIKLHTWSIYPLFMQVRYRLILESLQKIVARLDATNEDQLDNTDLLNLIKIAEYTLSSAPETASYQVTRSLETRQIEICKKAVEEIEQKFSHNSGRMPSFFRKFIFENNCYDVLVDNVKKNIIKQSNPRNEDPDMYLTARISSAIYRML